MKNGPKNDPKLPRKNLSLVLLCRISHRHYSKIFHREFPHKIKYFFTTRICRHGHANMFITKASVEKIWGNSFALPLRKRKQKSSFSSVIVSTQMVVFYCCQCQILSNFSGRLVISAEMVDCSQDRLSLGIFLVVEHAHGACLQIGCHLPASSSSMSRCGNKLGAISLPREEKRCLLERGFARKDPRVDSWWHISFLAVKKVVRCWWHITCLGLLGK